MPMPGLIRARMNPKPNPERFEHDNKNSPGAGGFNRRGSQASWSSQSPLPVAITTTYI